MTAPLTAAFRVDASSSLGGGHVMRCLTLAAELARRGMNSTFLVNPAASGTVPALAAAGHRIVELPPGGAPLVEHLRCNGRFDLVVFDHYTLDAEVERLVAPMTRTVAVIDDLADRPHLCDFLIDQTVGRREDSYASLVGGECTLLLGSEFALVRPAFAALRGRSLSRRRGLTDARSLLVSMGLTDVNGITAGVVRAVERLGFERIDVVLAEGAASWPGISHIAQERSDVRLHSADADMASLMAAADLAVGSAGTTSWERCCLGLPTVMLKLADNQDDVIAQLTARRAATAVANLGDLAAAVDALRYDGRELGRISLAAAALVDGQGASRVAQELVRRVKERARSPD